MTSTAISASSGSRAAPPERPAAGAPARDDDGFARVLDRVSGERDDAAARAEAKVARPKGDRAERAESPARDKDDAAAAPDAHGDAAAATGKAAATPRPGRADARKADAGNANGGQAAGGKVEQQGNGAAATAAGAALSPQKAAAGAQSGPVKAGDTEKGGKAGKESDADPVNPAPSAQGGQSSSAVAALPVAVPLPGVVAASAAGDADDAGAATATQSGAVPVAAGVMAGPPATKPDQASNAGGAPGDAAKGDAAIDAGKGSKADAPSGATAADPAAAAKAVAAGKLDPATLALLNRASAGGDPAGASDSGGGTAGPGAASPASGAAVPPGGVTPAANGVPAAPPAAPSQPPPTALAEQVAIQIARHAADGGSSRFEIRLDPAGLGRVDVRLDIHRDGHVQAVIAADRPETMALLNRDAKGLERALQNAGLKADSGSLSFSLRQDGGSGGSSFADWGGNAGGRSMGGGWTGDPTAPPEAARPLQAVSMLWRPGGVDIRI